MDGKLIQNNLAEATTEMGFPTDVNFPLQREVELEDGTTVTVEGVTPNKMKTILNQFVDGDEESITFLTPGEKYINGDVEIGGVCQAWNTSIIEVELESIAITTPPTKTSYFVGETFDTTGMVVTATYLNGATRPVTDYEISPSGELATTDTAITITYEGKTTTQAITVTEVVVTYFTLEAGKEYSFNTSALSQFILDNTSAEQKSASINIDSSDDTPFFWIPNINNSDDPVKNSFYIIADGDRKELSMYLNDDGIAGSKNLGDIEGESEISTVDLGDALNIMSIATGVISVPGSALNTTYLDDNCTIYLRYLPSGAENYVDYPLTLKLSTYITEAQI